MTPTHLLHLLSSLIFLTLAGILLGLPLYYIYVGVHATLYHPKHPAEGRSETTQRQGREIIVVKGSGRGLSSASRLDREIVVVRGSGRPWKEGVVVDKGGIRVVEGSGRPFGEHVFLEKRDNV
jgi:hypothetical protein